MTSDEAQSADAWLSLVQQKVAAIRFGSVLITVHEGRVTLVEAVEKTRISSEPAQTPEKAKRKH